MALNHQCTKVGGIDKQLDYKLPEIFENVFSEESMIAPTSTLWISRLNTLPSRHFLTFLLLYLAAAYKQKLGKT